MKQFETELIDALALNLLSGIIVVTVGQYFEEHPDQLDRRWHLWTKQDISTIRHIVDALNVPTVREFLENVIRKRFGLHMNRTVFILCVTAFDSFLERHGGRGTLGKKLGWLKKTFRISQELEDDVSELVARRNDVVHNNAFVSAKYVLSTGLYKGLVNSSWIARNGMPKVGEEHVFNADYQFLMLDRMWRIAKILCP